VVSFDWLTRGAREVIVNAEALCRAEQTLLRELDSRLQVSWHETLQDVINDLRIRWVDLKPDAQPDEVITAIHSYRLLDFETTQPLLEIRDTIQRIKQGTFGSCAGCGQEISGEILETQPNTKLCSSCAERLNSVRTTNQSQNFPNAPLQ